MSAGPIAVNAIWCTQIGMSTSAFVWIIISAIRSPGGTPTMSDVLNGALAGLAGA